MVILSILLFLVLVLVGAPLFVVIALIALFCFYSVGIPLYAVIGEVYRLTSAPVLLTIPLFTVTGFLLAESKAPQRIVRVISALFGWIPGGLAIVALISCAFFTAFTGASGVTIIALGGLLYPILLKEKYEEKFSLGLLTTGGSLGLLFPPSVPLILYGIVSKTNIDHLFLAGILPGVFLIIILSFYSGSKALSFNVERKRFCLKEVFSSLLSAWGEIPLPFIIIIGIYGLGIIKAQFTVTDAAAICALYVFVVQVLIRREISLLRELPKIIQESMVLVGGIIIILASALGLTNYLVDEQIPMKILSFMQLYISSKLMFLVVLNIFLLIVGCLMDIFSAIIIVVPLITPIALSFGVHPIHLGIIFLTNLEIGYATPPVGINLFISSFRFNKPILSLYKASLPFLVILLLALLIITYVPLLSLGLLEFLKISF
ncbi:MAG: TRAP transporter large permease subunit [Deltaproteobacteria bacterium]|nr:TRAP transporter large permease subunit [Deltaproteobacteria bacterium]